MKYTEQELDAAALADLLADAISSEAQALHGPFYPELGVTAENLTVYAAACREMHAKFRDGGAHKAVLAADNPTRDPDYDPTPWCAGCGSMTRSGCDCGPRAAND